VGSTAPEVFMSLSLLEKPHGYISATVDPATWAPLVDNCPAPPAPPCDLRAALAFVPSKNLGSSIDIRDCPNCLSNSPFIVPASGQPIELPAYLDQTRIFAVAGIVDFINFTFTFSKFGTASFAIDSSNTAASPKAVVIPLTMQMTDTTAVTMSLVDLLPQPGEGLVEFLLLDSPLYGFSIIGGVMGGQAIGATKISDYSYSVRGLLASEVAANPDLAGAKYGQQMGFQGENGMRLSLTTSDITETTQTVEVSSLLDIPTWIAPAAGETLDQPIGYDFSWQPVEGLTLYALDFAVPYFNGTETATKEFWNILIPPGTTTVELPDLPDPTLPAFESCSVYNADSNVIHLNGFDYSDGNFRRLDLLALVNPPTLLSGNTVAIFTSGTNCGPIITNEDPTEGNTGDVVTLSGKYFGATQGASTVMVGGFAAGITSWSDGSIVATVPAGCAGAGVVKLNVTVGGQISNDAYYQCD
jgi:hypothetical protein